MVECMNKYEYNVYKWIGMNMEIDLSGDKIYVYGMTDDII